MTIRTHVKIDEVLPHGDLLTTLCMLRARPPIIADLVPSVPELFIQQLYRKVTGEDIPRGLLPSEIREVVRSPIKRLQTSVIIQLFNGVEDIIDDRVGRYVHTYREYQRIFGAEAAYDFNRTWFIIRQSQIGRIGVGLCSKCNCYSAYNRDDVSDRRKCCGCHFKLRKKPAPERQAALTDGLVAEGRRAGRPANNRSISGTPQA